MDSFYIDQRVGDSRQSRSRASSHLSATAAQFQGLNITAPSSSVSPGQAQISRENTNTAPSYLDQESPRHSGSFVTSPLPQAYTPFPLITDDLDRNWKYASSYLASSPGHSTGTPVLRLDSASGDYLQEHHQLDTNIPPQSNIPPHSSNQSPSNMSALGIQNYDPRFDAGVRQSYTWPHLEMGNQYIPQNMSHSMSQSPGSLTPYDSNMPIYARSLSSSPPRAGLTPEQRELKRQREHARRDSKNRQRRDRSASNNSNPYIVSQSTTPDLMPRTLPEYQSNLTSAPLLQQPSPSLGSSPAFLSSYSPQLGNEPVQSDMYGPVFSMSPNDFTIPAYSMTYSNVGDASLHSYAPRPHSLSSASDAPSMYQSQSHASPPIGSPESGEGVRVVHSRPKPQCWEHGCNGRQFSTFSNLLRHQREKSGVATKSSCPHCGAEFTRTTARNGHMMHEKCKQQRRNS